VKKNNYYFLLKKLANFSEFEPATFKGELKKRKFLDIKFIAIYKINLFI